MRADFVAEAPARTRNLLTPACLESCKELARKLKLVHGSLDLIEEEDGSITFLEVNEMGQFLYLEERVPELSLLAAATAFSLDPRPDFRVVPDSFKQIQFQVTGEVLRTRSSLLSGRLT